ncbi:hypothetical protein [Roseovarius sp. MMSF_3281]|uniref:hypothetical protein n=1 Tax=Roseovarius sp. MMSF_3281 TaxID=3046694 RepID=UPI00273FA088|nr:hypothetical protein [Roseovarius sp. MMSF_3281]
MSAPGLNRVSAKAQAARLARLAKAGQLVQLGAIKGGRVLHTGCGFGPEFWLLPDGADPDSIAFDSQNAAPIGAALVCDGLDPVTTPEALRARGAEITMRIPQL